jgi:hypothetical protein
MLGAGFSYLDILGFNLASRIFSVLALLAVRKYASMRYISIGFIAFAAELLVLPHITSTYGLILFGVFDGLTLPFFWVPYNTAYFGMRKGTQSAFLAGLIFLVSPLLGIVAPLIAGYIIDAYGIIYVFLGGAAVLTASGAYYGTRRSESFTVELKKAWAEGKGIKSLVFIQGFWQGVDWLCVPLITLYFLTSGVSYGGFFSIVAIFGAASSLYFCHLSDKTGNRVHYLYPSIVMTAAATILSAYTSDLINWVIVRGMVGFFVAVANPFTTSIVLDRMKSTPQAMYLREILMGLGRLAGAVAVIACQLLLGSIQYAFVPAGLLLLTYPLIVENKRLYKAADACNGVQPHEPLEYVQSGNRD